MLPAPAGMKVFTLKQLAFPDAGARVMQGQYLSPRATNLVLQYLTHAVKLASSWKALKPEALALLQRVIFPLLCFSEDDDRLWRDDPQEFIRKASYCLLFAA